MPGVLVLVEKHYPITISLGLSDDGVFGGQTSRQRHLCSEIENTAGTHLLYQLGDDRDELRSFMLCLDQTQQPGARAALPLVRARRQSVNQLFQLVVRGEQIGGVHQMLGQLTGQREHLSGDRTGRLLRIQIPIEVTDQPERQLPQLRFRQQPRVGLHGQQQSMLTQQGSRIGVVRGDHRIGFVGTDGSHDPASRQPGQSRSDPAQQLARGLAREGQPEHLAGGGIAVGHQPHHPRGHRLGLTRPGTRDDHHRARWRADDGGLLVGGLEKP